MSFLSNYMEYTSGNEAPQQYHRWCALLVLACVASRRFWLNMGHYNVTPNLYVVLLGPPGNKKTTAMSIARRMVKELGVPLSAECQTKEALCKEWPEHLRSFKQANGEVLIYTPMSIFVTELSHFLGGNAAHMLDFLTTVFDIQDSYTVKTKNKGSEEVKGPYITLCGCTTPEWITTYLKQDIISGGFSRRCIFVNEYENDKPIAIPSVTPAQEEAYRQCRLHLEALLSEGGEFHFDQEGRKFYVEWYEWQFRNCPTDINVRAYYKTKFVQMLKVAVLIALSNDISSRLVTKPIIEAALKLLELTEQNLEAVYSGVGRNQLNSVSHKLIEMLRIQGGPMTEKQVRGMLWRDAQVTDIDQVLNYLRSQDKIKLVSQERPDKPPVLLYVLTEHYQKLCNSVSSAQNSSPPGQSDSSQTEATSVEPATYLPSIP